MKKGIDKARNAWYNGLRKYEKPDAEGKRQKGKIMKKAGAFKDYKSRKIAGVTVSSYEEAIEAFKNFLKLDDCSVKFIVALIETTRALREIGFSQDEVDEIYFENAKAV